MPSFLRPVAAAASACALSLLVSACSGVVSLQGDAEKSAEPTQRPAETSGTSPAPSRAAGAGDAGAAGTARTPPRLRRFYTQQVRWHPCEGGFACTRVRVPLDYARPDGTTITLAVSRRPADDPGRRAGALLVNPGGPGVSGVSYAPMAAGQLSADVLDRYDVVGFDPRGVAASEGVDCLSDAELDAFVALDPTPDDAQAVVRARRTLARFGRGCVDGSGPLVGHVSTPEAARDMDVIRAVVGSPRMNYYGGSYGTLLGATYAELFPRTVGRMVLDGAIDPSLSVTQTALQQTEGFQTALRSYLEHCARRPDCPLGSTADAAEDRLKSLLDQIDDQPLPGESGRPLTVGNAVLGVWLPLYAPELWPTLDVALDSAIRGDGAALMRLSDFYVSRGPKGYQDNSIEALYAVNCLDHPGGRGVAGVRRALPRFEQASPVLGEVFAWSLLGCPGWPVRTSEPIPRIDARGAPPIVVVGTTGDPATPYHWAVSLARQLRSGVLVTRVGDGHTGFGRGNACVDTAVNDYLADGTVPEDGLRCS